MKSLILCTRALRKEAFETVKVNQDLVQNYILFVRAVSAPFVDENYPQIRYFGSL